MIEIVSNMPAYRVVYSNGKSYTTSVATGITLKDAREYFIGSTHLDRNENVIGTVSNVEPLDDAGDEKPFKYLGIPERIAYHANRAQMFLMIGDYYNAKSHCTYVKMFTPQGYQGGTYDLQTDAVLAVLAQKIEEGHTWPGQGE